MNRKKSNILNIFSDFQKVAKKSKFKVKNSIIKIQKGKAMSNIKKSKKKGKLTEPIFVGNVHESRKGTSIFIDPDKLIIDDSSIFVTEFDGEEQRHIQLFIGEGKNGKPYIMQFFPED